MNKPVEAKGAGLNHACQSISRRNFLILGGASVTVLATVGRGAEAQELVSSSYTRKVIGKVSALEKGKAISFNYPTDDIENLVMMLEEEAGGGVGEARNIVAFNTICPHMGGYMGEAEFKSQHSVLGPCPLHLSTFDLSRHGMIVSGHSSASLPQIILEIDGDDIVATGVMGLFYGYSQNPSGA
ncbi:Rieske 2Fe-2S domain-containing protein [Aliiroseovarius sp. S1339]|uniref:Rieske 2Fe-2S domain-containing protein n=1 Tax=Aliiroseovarius sp. S1339 TaxID=2936990 RepID=UPI0020BEB72F|nr:Rieske 2Fe-2S domain-containing protein [Aliiroseovarius sp. S1339]MCK8464015.1 Rieske 2Fe-2S domain-containing protein [Aliiroseovarius sp. S1339]